MDTPPPTKRPLEDEIWRWTLTEGDDTPPNKEEIEKMIAGAITRHNRNASIISMWIGFFFLGAFMDGLFRMLGLIPPFLDIDISLIPKIKEALGTLPLPKV